MYYELEGAFIHRHRNNVHYSLEESCQKLQSRFIIISVHKRSNASDIQYKKHLLRSCIVCITVWIASFPFSLRIRHITWHIFQIECSMEYRVSVRKKGINRIGNLLIRVPTQNYWVRVRTQPLIDQKDWVDEKWAKTILLLLSNWGEIYKNDLSGRAPKWFYRLRKEINDESSVFCWASQKKITIFCPALTDGSGYNGDVISSHWYSKECTEIALVLHQMGVYGAILCSWIKSK